MSAHARAVWHDIGPTGSGRTDIWTALDSIPETVDWIELRTYLWASMNCTATQAWDLAIGLYARKNGTAVGTVSTILGANAVKSYSQNGNHISLGCFGVGKVPVDGRQFDMLYTLSTGVSPPFAIASWVTYLVGYGWNRPRA